MYVPWGSMEPLNVIEPVVVHSLDCPLNESFVALMLPPLSSSVDCPLNESFVALIVPVVLDKDICPLTPVTSMSPELVSACRSALLGTVTSR